MTRRALWVVSFGGPEAPEEVMPFLEHVTRGRGVPRERLLAVREHYLKFGGRSPINDQNRALVAALREALRAADLPLTVHWGNRHARPFLAESLEEMARAGVTECFAFVTSAFGSYPGCRAYRDAIREAVASIGPTAPTVHVLRRFGNHPRFLDAVTGRVERARERLGDAGRSARVVFTAHSIPSALAAGSPYVESLREAAGIVAARLGVPRWDLVWQSRSGPPQVPWLEPDVGDHLRALASEGVDAVLVAPIGFVSDHMEVVYDLDTEARALARSLGLRFERAETVGTHPAFVEMIVELVRERIEPGGPRRALGVLGAAPDECPETCCPAPTRPVSARPGA